jgi:hypothetical protein
MAINSRIEVFNKILYDQLVALNAYLATVPNTLTFPAGTTFSYTQLVTGSDSTTETSTTTDPLTFPYDLQSDYNTLINTLNAAIINWMNLTGRDELLVDLIDSLYSFVSLNTTYGFGDANALITANIRNLYRFTTLEDALDTNIISLFETLRVDDYSLTLTTPVPDGGSLPVTSIEADFTVSWNGPDVEWVSYIESIPSSLLTEEIEISNLTAIFSSVIRPAIKALMFEDLPAVGVATKQVIGKTIFNDLGYKYVFNKQVFGEIVGLPSYIDDPSVAESRRVVGDSIITVTSISTATYIPI